MNFALTILAYLCLAQGLAHGHSIAVRAATSSNVQDAVNTAMATVSSLAGPVSNSIIEGNRLLHEYSDNSTDYAAAFNINIVTEITNTFKTIDKAFSDAATTANAANSTALDCLTAERNQTQTLAINIVEEILKCGITKVRQFVDLGINMAMLGNTTLFLVPNTNAKIQNCTQEANDFFRYSCIGWQVAGAAAKLAEVSIGVGTTVAAGSALYGTIQADLVLCAEAKLFGFRQTAISIPLTIGMCLGRTALKG